MQEMEEEYSHDEQANNAVTSRGVFVTIGTAMDEYQPGQAPPTVLDKGKGPLVADDIDRAKVMTPPPNPVQQPQELGTGPSNNNTANLPPLASTSAAAQVTPADRVMYVNLLVEPLTVAHIRNVTQLDEKRQQLLEEAQAIAEQGAMLDRDLVNAQNSIEKSRAMEAEYKTLLQQQKAKKALARVINDPGVWQNLGWAPPKPAQAKPYIDSEGRQVMPTPLLNLAVAKTLLEQDRSPEAVDQVYDLVAKAVKQQEKATSQRLDSDPALC